MTTEEFVEKYYENFYQEWLDDMNIRYGSDYSLRDLFPECYYRNFLGEYDKMPFAYTWYVVRCGLKSTYSRTYLRRETNFKVRRR
jgi:hypothetical protein